VYLLKNFKVQLTNEPGSLGKLTSILAQRGINIDGACGMDFDTNSILNMVTSDPEGAKIAIKDASFSILEERDVLIVMTKNHPGTLSTLTNKLGNAGVNIDFFYIGTNNRMVFGVDDLKKAQDVISNVYEHHTVEVYR
jgi:hypothetical protein